jgi:hypothetical protein
VCDVETTVRSPSMTGHLLRHPKDS